MHKCVIIINLSYFRTKWVKTNGHEYKINAGVILDVKHDLPVVGKIKDIHVVDGHKILFCVKSVFHFLSHISNHICYKMILIFMKKLCICQICSYQILYIRTSQVLGSHKFVLLPYALCTL